MTNPSLAPQLLITLIIFSIAFIFKVSLVVYSKWYEDTQYVFGDIMSELYILAITILVNLFALYGMSCSLKGNCIAYSYIITFVIVVAFVLDLFNDIAGYKIWLKFAQECSSIGGLVDMNKRLCVG